jgi:hypothetical protein
MKYVAFAEMIDNDDLAFVARAVSCDDDRPQFWYMKITENDNGFLAIAIDGKRLHQAELGNKGSLADLSPGFWRVLKNKTVEERDFEAEEEFSVLGIYEKHRVYKRKRVLWIAKLDKFDLFPSLDEIDRLLPKNFTQQGVVSTCKHRHDSMQNMIKELPKFVGINPGFLKDLGQHEWKYAFEPGKAVLFEHENKTALIMPIDTDPKWNTKN